MLTKHTYYVALLHILCLHIFYTVYTYAIQQEHKAKVQLEKTEELKKTKKDLKQNMSDKDKRIASLECELAALRFISNKSQICIHMLLTGHGMKAKNRC